TLPPSVTNRQRSTEGGSGGENGGEIQEVGESVAYSLEVRSGLEDCNSRRMRSKSAMAPAVAAFREVTFPTIGISRTRSQCRLTPGDTPVPSAPTTIASGLGKSVVKRFCASGP